VRAAAADALGRIGPRDHAAVFALVTAQRDADETVRTAARDALTRLGKSAVPILVGALDEPDREVRCGAARALGVIHAKDAAAAESLLKHLYDADADFRTACREGLVGIGPGSVGPLSGALKAGDAPTRIAAAEVLKKLGPRAQEALPALVAAAKDADSQVRTAALAALRDVVTVPADGKLDPAGESALQAFTVGLRDADGEVRIAAHLGMIRLGRAAAPALATALGDKDAPVRRLATETLQKLGPDARLAVPELIAALRDADAEVRDGAGWALEALDPELRAALPALRAALAAPPKPMPIAVVAKEFCYRTVAELAALAAGQPGDLSRQALQELSLRRGEEALTALALAAVSDDRDTRALGREMLLKCLDKRPDDKAEDAAARRLKLARRLLEEGKTDAAHEDIRTLIQSQPRTRAAEEGRRLLAEAKPQE
jgi:HEAT repeat protein